MLISLKSKYDFDQLYKKGFRKRSEYLLFSFKTNDLDHCRWGFTISKYVGKAHLRNKFRRWSKELIRKNEIHVHMDVNVVFMRKKEEFYKNVSFSEYETKFNELIDKISLPH